LRSCVQALGRLPWFALLFLRERFFRPRLLMMISCTYSSRRRDGGFLATILARGVGSAGQPSVDCCQHRSRDRVFLIPAYECGAAKHLFSQAWD
jgi:hypothetical protein